jgi:hypothetical protein
LTLERGAFPRSSRLFLLRRNRFRDGSGVFLRDKIPEKPPFSPKLAYFRPQKGETLLDNVSNPGKISQNDFLVPPSRAELVVITAQSQRLETCSRCSFFVRSFVVLFFCERSSSRLSALSHRRPSESAELFSLTPRYKGTRI